MAVSVSRVCVRLGLAFAPQLAQAPFFALRRAQALGGRFGLAARRFGGAALHVLLPGKDAEPAALLQPARGGNGALGGRDETVPAPQVALAARPDAGPA